MHLRNSIVKMSFDGIRQFIRLHFGLQFTCTHSLDFADIKIELGEKPDDLYQRLVSFVEDNLLEAGGNITHHGKKWTDDEQLMPTVENIIVLTWLWLIHTDLSRLVKQRHCTELTHWGRDKWTPFRRRHFQAYFLEWKWLNSD